MHDQPEPNPCYLDSRRLTGPNRYFAETAVVLEPIGPGSLDVLRHEDWRARVTLAWHTMGWGDPSAIVHRHAGGVILVCKAPWQLLFTATEVNEWAWEQASGWFARGETPVEPPHASAALFNGRAIDATQPLVADFAQAAAHYKSRAEAEERPALTALSHSAQVHDLDFFHDDESASVGSGRGSSAVWPIAALPEPHDIDWAEHFDIPRVLVTGSNGKTTTVRLIAAIANSAGQTAGYCCTEGVFVGGTEQSAGDYSGPAGARTILRDTRVAVAVLETARGGIARRGLAVQRADVAVVTNISADHFGEFGIDSLADLAMVKLAVARPLGTRGTLILNADDPTLAARIDHVACPVALFAESFANPHVERWLARGRLAAAVDADHLWLNAGATLFDLGPMAQMPLAAGGAARYNVANLMAAALAAFSLGFPVDAIRSTFASFGRSPDDNAGRLERYDLRGVTVLIDYAHNPEGYAGLIAVGRSIAAPRAGRIGITIGHAGNRTNEALVDVAKTVAAAKLAMVVVKEIDAMLRGRAAGEISRILLDALREAGQQPATLANTASEEAAAQRLLDWAKPGDVVLLPIHQKAARVAVRAMLHERRVGNDPAPSAIDPFGGSSPGL